MIYAQYKIGKQNKMLWMKLWDSMYYNKILKISLVFVGYNMDTNELLAITKYQETLL